MDVLENILEQIAACQEQREMFMKQADGEEQKIGKLESMYYLLEDPATAELMATWLSAWRFRMAWRSQTVIPESRVKNTTSECSGSAST